MKVQAEVLDKIVQGGIQEKWEYFKSLDHYEGYEEDFELVKNGINIKFDIRYLFVDTNQIIVKDKEGKVLIDKKPYKREEYWDELDERESIMIEGIYNSIENKSMLVGRE